MINPDSGKPESVKKISVIVPRNPFVRDEAGKVKHCLAALDVMELMEWWPGTPHSPHRDPKKVQAIQRSLDWKRVARIAAYLLQREIVDAPQKLDKYFRQIYGPKAREPGRQWPPKVPRVIGFEKSTYPTFPSVLLHVNGASVETRKNNTAELKIDANEQSPNFSVLKFDPNDRGLNFSVIDGQHRINGAFFAVKLLNEEKSRTKEESGWDIPAEIFLDLDEKDQPPKRQAQIFIDVNFNQKKVDRSLVADLFPTARGDTGTLDDKERSQDLGRKLMLEIGPLVGMIQIPGIHYGMPDVITLATLNSAIEDILPDLARSKITSLDGQAIFLAQCLDAWLEASGRRHGEGPKNGPLRPGNVIYQGRVLVSFLTLIPACLWVCRREKSDFVSGNAHKKLVAWLREVMGRAGMLKNGAFLEKSDFKEKGFLGSGGLARFRDFLWAAVNETSQSIGKMELGRVAELATKNRSSIQQELAKA